jgi:hypothetical protein
MNHKKIIPLIPLSHNIPKEQIEKEQPGSIEFNCPDCHQPTWISKKKRDMALDSGYRVTCWDCIKKWAFFQDMMGNKHDVKMERV